MGLIFFTPDDNKTETGYQSVLLVYIIIMCQLVIAEYKKQ